MLEKRMKNVIASIVSVSLIGSRRQILDEKEGEIDRNW